MQKSLHIYIPIWIDLKANRQHDNKNCMYNLHSNMDRFESLNYGIGFNHSKNIYIPIWIDLKEQDDRQRPRPRFDLHSNMDRFER